MGVGVRVLVGVFVGKPAVTVKKAEEKTPHLSLSLLPCTRRRWRPTGREEISIAVVTVTTPLP